MHIPIRFSSSKKYNGGVSVEYDDGYRQELPPYTLPLVIRILNRNLNRNLNRSLNL